jgi:RND superfamily putative drug exporter
VTVPQPPSDPFVPTPQPAPHRGVLVRVLRRPLAWAILVLVAWWLVAAFAGPLAGKLQEVQKNDNASFLPATAESTEVNNLQATFAENQSFPLFVLFVRGSGLTDADKQFVTSYTQSIGSLPLVDDKGKAHSGGKTIGSYLTGQPPAAIPAQDGRALLVTMAINSDSISKALPDNTSPVVAIVETLRYHDKGAPTGTRSYVTGIGGIFADEFKVFGSLDTTLLSITGLVVAVILILVYRSPVLWFVPLLSALLSLSAASGLVYVLAKNNVLTLNGQSQGILTVLVFGAATDYALLLVARYREELHNVQSEFHAMRRAWRSVFEPLVASATTVCIGLLCLLFSELNSNKSTGPVAAIGIACALVATLTILPALLVIPAVAFYLEVVFLTFLVSAFVLHAPIVVGLVAVLLLPLIIFSAVARSRGRGPSWMPWIRWPKARWVFWPKVPQFGAADEKLAGVWARIAATLSRRARLSWVAMTLILLVAAFFATQLKANGLGLADSFTSQQESVVGQTELGKHFAAGSGNPAVIIARADHVNAVVSVAQTVPGIAQVVLYTGTQTGAAGPGQQPKVVDGLVQMDATLKYPSDSPQAQDTVQRLRDAVHAVAGADAKVGGFTAINYDTQKSSQRDRTVIIPIVLLVILLILMLLLRAVVGPVLLILSVLLSYFATLGVCALVFHRLFHFAGEDSSFPLFVFVFLVAFGVDYNIFLMTRVREESKELGTRRGILKGLTVTGGVITSAGLVLAATFSVLGSLPLVFLAELGFAVAFGVLLDTLLVRTFLVPALTYDVGRPIWWPSQLARVAEPAVGAGRGGVHDVPQPVA